MSIRKFINAALSAISVSATAGTVRAQAANTQDAVKLQGRAGGTNSFEVIITPLALSATQTQSLPNASGTFALISIAQVWEAPQTFDDVIMGSGKNIALATDTGTKIGTDVAQKLGFWNATAIVQPAHADQAAVATQTQAGLTDNTGGTASVTLAAITAGAAYDQADLIAIKDAIASLAARFAEVKTDVTNIKTHQDATRTALVNSGLMKGAA